MCLLICQGYYQRVSVGGTWRYVYVNCQLGPWNIRRRHFSSYRLIHNQLNVLQQSHRSFTFLYQARLRTFMWNENPHIPTVKIFTTRIKCSFVHNEDMLCKQKNLQRFNSGIFPRRKGRGPPLVFLSDPPPASRRLSPMGHTSKL